LPRRSAAAGAKDWLDIEGVLTRQAAALDASLILRELRPLLELEEDLEALDRLRVLLGRRSD
jgi:hypothetical protein